MKVIFLALFFIYSNLYAESELENTARMVNKSLDSIKKTGVISSPCQSNLEGTSAIILDAEFSSNGVGDNCFKYIESNGEVGSWGKSVIEAIYKLPKDEIQNSYLANSFTDMELVCPNYKNFNEQLKLKFWVWTFAAISWQESSCNPKTTAQGINSKAVGLLQLEDSLRLRAGRGGHCEVKDVKQANNNIACGVEILHQQLLGPKSTYFTNSTGELFWKSGYWQHLRLRKRTQVKEQELIDQSQSPSNSKTNIKELVMRFPNCR
jgi:hypothetical protein